MSNPNRPFGWRKRIGLLSPTVIETAAYDFYRLAPDGVSMCATTSNIEHWVSGQAGGRRRQQKPCTMGVSRYIPPIQSRQENAGNQSCDLPRTCPGGLR